jgi:hypothetical protein
MQIGEASSSANTFSETLNEKKEAERRGWAE